MGYQDEFTRIFRTLSNLEMVTIGNEDANMYVTSLFQQMHELRSRVMNGLDDEDVNLMAAYYEQELQDDIGNRK